MVIHIRLVSPGDQFERVQGEDEENEIKDDDRAKDCHCNAIICSCADVSDCSDIVGSASDESQSLFTDD